MPTPDSTTHHRCSERVGHGHQLRLVAEFGEEDDTETDERGGEHDGPFDASPGEPMSPALPDVSVEGLAHRGNAVRLPGFTPVCRHDDWGLLPFADDTDHNGQISGYASRLGRVRAPVIRACRDPNH